MPSPRTRKPSALLTAHEVADLAKVDIRTVRRWIKAKDLPASRLGRTVRIAVTDYQAFIQAHKMR